MNNFEIILLVLIAMLTCVACAHHLMMRDMNERLEYLRRRIYEMGHRSISDLCALSKELSSFTNHLGYVQKTSKTEWVKRDDN